MANVDKPNGFVPYGPILRLRPYYAAVACFRGDMMNQKAGSTQTGGLVDVEPADATEACIGVALNSAGVGGTVWVADHPDQEFVGQADESDFANASDLGLNYNLLATDGAGDLSAHEIDSSTQNTTATLPIKALRLLPAADNAFGANARIIFKINNHQLGSHTGTAGV